MPPITPLSLREKTQILLDLHDIEVQPWLDEQQLVDEAVIKKLVDLSEVSPDETVLEIGPGTGNITAALLERAGNVIAVEKNFKYLLVLKGRFGKEPRLEIIHHDILFYRIPAVDRVVSNLPYMISEAIIRRLFKVHLKSATFIVSSGFAEIITATPGDERYSKLTYLVGLFYDARLE
ncbi:methyltransferase domain-containing protein, partial [Candidatus Bathyarchaeota archaeon]|nr:methyltransferase domain-containing protein [Candidatus Bathyarchaeota archaeon]